LAKPLLQEETLKQEDLVRILGSRVASPDGLGSPQDIAD
jgi:hypothetical protein